MCIYIYIYSMCVYININSMHIDIYVCIYTYVCLCIYIYTICVPSKYCLLNVPWKHHSTKTHGICSYPINSPGFFTHHALVVNTTIENCLVEILDCGIHSMVIFHSYANVYQRVHPMNSLLKLHKNPIKSP